VVIDDRPNMPADFPVPLPRPRQKRVQLLWSAAQLICGIAIGVGATLYLVKDRITKPPDGRNPSDIALKIAREMKERYDLTEGQSTRVSELMQASMKKRQDIVTEFGKQMAAEDTRIRDQMQKILTPEQFDEYTEDMRRMAEHWRRRGSPFFVGPGRPGGPGPGPGRGARRNDGTPGPRDDGRGFGPLPDGQGPRPGDTSDTLHWRGPGRDRPGPPPQQPPDPNAPKQEQPPVSPATM
jgi:hypothetical protein